MNRVSSGHWWDLQFYQGLLPVKDAIAARSYVILADDNETPHTSSDITWLENGAAHSPPLSEPANVQDAAMDDLAETSSVKVKSLCDGVSFFMYQKKDVSPPLLLCTLSPNRVNCCFKMCSQEGCGCERLHVLQDTWKLRVDTLKPISLTVCERGRNIRISHDNIIPTAGYFFALGLLEVQAVQAVVPTLCRFNSNCKHGCYCLFIHANIDVKSAVVHDANTPLRKWIEPSALNFLAEQEQCEFFNFLFGKGVETVGDLQILGDSAFESLLANIPPCWAEAMLVASQFRNFDSKAFLEDVLLTFPRVKQPIQLPAGLQRVGDLLKIPLNAFYQFDWLPHVLNACEIIRARFGSDEKCKVIRLSKEPPNSFLTKVTQIIARFRAGHAHCSWRKHNPHRTVVTSVLTYVDVRHCSCGQRAPSGFQKDAAQSGKNLNDRIYINGDDDGDVIPLLPAISPEQAVGAPEHSWCVCPRRWVVGVNYELSTPSGSRCSEQNAMGKLASLGVPTWSVRELFVHGANAENVNPLFPCGVCDNMLQKVAKDVHTWYGGEVRLFMFDTTVPHKMVHLPISEISQRAGSSFKRFVESDLQN